MNLQSDTSKKKIIAWAKHFLGAKIGAIYLFGSHASGQNNAASDLDLAIWLPEKPKAEAAYGLKTELSAYFKCDVDLVDLARADSVTKAQIVSRSILLYSENINELAAFETQVFSEYALLNEERSGIVKDFLER